MLQLLQSNRYKRYNSYNSSNGKTCNNLNLMKSWSNCILDKWMAINSLYFKITDQVIKNNFRVLVWTTSWSWSTKWLLIMNAQLWHHHKLSREGCSSSEDPFSKDCKRKGGDCQRFKGPPQQIYRESIWNISHILSWFMTYRGLLCSRRFFLDELKDVSQKRGKIEAFNWDDGMPLKESTKNYVSYSCF
jgi:hypothetical protein